MQSELEILSILGFKSNIWIKNKDGISIYVPEDVKSNDWCIDLPNHININGKIQNFCYYDVSFSFVISVLEKYFPKKKIVNDSDKSIKNCVAVYRDKKNLTFKELGNIVGVTKQRAEQICKSNIRKSTIKSFAEYEGISVEEFKMIYRE